MAVDKNGNDIVVADLGNWINDSIKYKTQLSEFIYDRLHGRYIRPFEFDDSKYKKHFKNGFTIMANCCLLIETFVSFKKLQFKDSNGKSEKCFGWFFVTENAFSKFSQGGLPAPEYLSEGRIRNRGVPRDFYRNVRCGILHNGETRNGWKIVREGSLYDAPKKTINATKFMKELKTTLQNYRILLNKSEIDTEIWNNFIERIKFLLDRT